jgi:hypothetical protein
LRTSRANFRFNKPPISFMSAVEPSITGAVHRLSYTSVGLESNQDAFMEEIKSSLLHCGRRSGPLLLGPLCGIEASEKVVTSRLRSKPLNESQSPR